jgi:hypothetical protein
MAAVADGMAVEAVRSAVGGTTLATACTAEVLIGTAVAGTGVVVTGTAVAGMMGVVAGIMVVTAVGELAPRLASVLALDCSGEHWQRLLITAATTMGTITPRMPVHPHLRFGIGAMPIRAITLRCRNARFRGGKLFSSAWAKPDRLAEA